jgi:hypothetical protein
VVVDLVVGEEALGLAQLDQLRLVLVDRGGLLAGRALGLGLHGGGVGGLLGRGAARDVVVVVELHLLARLAIELVLVVEVRRLALGLRLGLGRAHRLGVLLGALGLVGGLGALDLGALDLHVLDLRALDLARLGGVLAGLGLFGSGCGRLRGRLLRRGGLGHG